MTEFFQVALKISIISPLVDSFTTANLIYFFEVETIQDSSWALNTAIEEEQTLNLKHFDRNKGSQPFNKFSNSQQKFCIGCHKIGHTLHQCFKNKTGFPLRKGRFLLQKFVVTVELKVIS